MKTAEEYKRIAVERAQNKSETYKNHMIDLLWGVVENCLIAGKKTQSVSFQNKFGKPDVIIKHFNEVGIVFEKIGRSGYDDDYTQYTMDISVLYNKENQ